MSVPFYWEEIVLMVLLGGLLAVDERAGWQSMFSQPVISGATVGVILGDFVTGVSVGVVLELVWLSVLPMRGARKPDGVAGSIVGAGTACLIVKHTGDPRIVFIAALGAVIGLIVGEVAGVFGRRINRKRDRTLGRFEVSDDNRVLQRRLLLYFLYSVSFIFAAEVVMVFVMLLPSVLLAEWLTRTVRLPFVTAAQWWIIIVPTLGAGALVQMYWHKQQNRYLALFAGIVLILLWFK